MGSDPTPHQQQPDRPWRVLVTGSRAWTDTAAITRALDDLHARYGEALRIVHGACPHGADAIAHQWAARHHVPVEAHPADWSTGRGAGPTRNTAMVATRPDQCLAFIADASRGATGTADLAETAGIPATRHTPTPPDHARDELVHNNDDQLVAVVDGPLAGEWFTWPDWQARLNAARYIEDRTGRRSPVLDYRPGGYEVANPVLAHTRGWAAIHQPSATPSTAADDEAGQGSGAVDVQDALETRPAAEDQAVAAQANEATVEDGDAHGDDDVFDLAG